ALPAGTSAGRAVSSVPPLHCRPRCPRRPPCKRPAGGGLPLQPSSPSSHLSLEPLSIPSLLLRPDFPGNATHFAEWCSRMFRHRTLLDGIHGVARRLAGGRCWV